MKRAGDDPLRAVIVVLLALALVVAATALVATIAGGDCGPSAALPFQLPSRSTLRASPKKVFAHYFDPFPISLDNLAPASDYYTTGYLAPGGESNKWIQAGGYMRDRPLPRNPLGSTWKDLDMEEEVRRASAAGLDGFTVDLLGSPDSATSVGQTHWDRAMRLIDAANRIDPTFKLIAMPDMNAEFSPTSGHFERLENAMVVWAAKPAAYRMANGRLVMAPFNGQNQSASVWAAWLDMMRNTHGVDIAFFPLMQNWKTYATAFQPFSVGFTTVAYPWLGGVATAARDLSDAHGYGVLWAGPVSPQDYRPKDVLDGPSYAPRFWEPSNTRAFRATWESHIATGADWVHVMTWNDYGEHTVIAPSPQNDRVWLDLTSYYLTWFKTGAPPTITQDVLYGVHRIESTMAAPTQSSTTAVLGGGDAAKNEVELLAFLKAPGTLEIVLGGTTAFAAPAGITSLRAPLVNGTPTFRLLRDSVPIITMTGAAISSSFSYQDLLYRANSSAR